MATAGCGIQGALILPTSQDILVSEATSYSIKIVESTITKR